MLLPIGHENMSARRWPVITLALIVINVVVFLCTFQSLDEQAPHLREVRVHILLLAAMHPELAMPPASQQLVDDFQKRNPSIWKQRSGGRMGC
jgi:hypothetical protein